MKRDRKHHYLLAAVIAIGAEPLMPAEPQARADEPVEECQTQVKWAAKVGNQGAVAQGACPTRGICDTPSERDSWIPDSFTPTVHLRIRLHVFCESNGTNCASTQEGVAAALAKLNSDYYGPDRFQFTPSVEYINSSTYRNFSDSEEVAMKNTYADDPGRQINVYVVNILGGYRGVGTFPWDPDSLVNMGGIIVDDDAFGEGKTTLTHEVGHNLGLWHTHHGVGEVSQCSACYERADGVDGDTTGDFASDTPPTPTHSSGTCVEISASIIDPCSVPPRPWVPTQYHNFMGYATQECRTLFTPQQAGRKHCWIHDVLTSWIAAYCGDGGCGQGEDPCNCPTDCGTPPATEVPNSTCQDGVDNDCDGYADCDDVLDCASDPACHCTDNGGNSPVVCVNWVGAVPPELDIDFRVDFVTDANSPGVTFLTGNNIGWKLWSQVSWTDDTPANLGHIKIDPELSTANFKVTIAHGPYAGAANVKSIALVKAGWTGQSNLMGSSITGDLDGDLVLQESEGGGGGVLSFTIGGDLNGNITIPKVNALDVKGAVSSGSTITLFSFVFYNPVVFNMDAGTFAGDLSLPNGLPSGNVVAVHGLLTDTASVDFNGQDLAGSLSFFGGSAEQSVINIGPLTGNMQLNGIGSAYLGSATFTSVESTGSITIFDADLGGSINVLEDCKGTLQITGGTFGPEGVISIDGRLADTGSLYLAPETGGMAGDILIAQDCDGPIEVLDFFEQGDTTGDILVGGRFNHFVIVFVKFNGNICGENVSATAPLPGNIVIPEFGPNGKVCGRLVCGIAAQADPGVSKNRALSFSVPPSIPAVNVESAIRVMLVDLQNPNPANAPQYPPPNFGAFESATCTAVGETNGCARWIGKPGTFLEYQDTGVGGGTYHAARLQCTPFYHDWSTEGVFHVVGAEILPSSTYELQAVPVVGNFCAAPITITFHTARYGDVAASYQAPSPANLSQPDALDVVALVNKFKSVPGSPSKAQSQLQPNLPELNADLSALDIVACVNALKSFAYPSSGPCPCPSAVTCGSMACPSGPTPCVTAFGAGSMCVKTCGSGIHAGQPCINDKHCNFCLGGTSNGQPCLPGGCPGGGFCGGGVCTKGRVGQSCSTNDSCDTEEGICNIYNDACRDGNGQLCGTCPFGQQSCHCDGTCADATPATCGVKTCSDNGSLLCTSDAQCPSPQKCLPVGFCRDRCGRCNQ